MSSPVSPLPFEAVFIIVHPQHPATVTDQSQDAFITILQLDTVQALQLTMMATAAGASAAAGSSPRATRAAPQGRQHLSRPIPTPGPGHRAHHGHRDPYGGDLRVPAPNFPCSRPLPLPRPCGHSPGLSSSLCDQHPKAQWSSAPVESTKRECPVAFIFTQV